MAGAPWKKMVGRYEVGWTIGHGSFGKVKFAVDADTGVPVAMKALLLSASRDAAVDFEYCNKGRHYPVKVSGMQISPDPVVRGKPATFKISASTVLRMEQDILKFLRDPGQTQFKFQGLPTSSRIILRKTSAECRLPAVRLADIPVNLPQEETSVVATKVAIKQRPQKNHHGGAGAGANSSRGNLQKSVEERKEEYNRVRARIFNNISGSSSPVDGRPADEVVLPNTLHRCTSLELNPNTRYDELAEATLERSLTSTASSSRSNNRSMIDKEPPVNRGMQGNRLAIFRDRDSDRKDPDYDRSYDRFVPHNMASVCCYLIWGFLCRNKEYLISTVPTFN
ncbi:60S ribosomal protein L10a-2 [Hordeum vulgare]|nr:60S ribosomal protein L10a-2 [Hordeum vulgare]